MLIPDYNQEIPESTIQVAQAAFPKGNPYLTGGCFNKRVMSGSLSSEAMG